MWQEGAGTAEVLAPPQARLRVPLRNGEEPISMGDDAWLRQSSMSDDRTAVDSVSVKSDNSATNLVVKNHGSTSLNRSTSRQTDEGTYIEVDELKKRLRSPRRLSMNVNSSNLNHLGNSEIEDDDDDDPSLPIGLLAAIGTKYAKKPIYKSRKFKILCPIIGFAVLAVNVVVLLFPVLRAIAVHTLSTTVMSVSTSNITQATDTSFTLTLEGQARKVGIFPAHLYFNNPVDVYWIAPENLSQELHLGSFPLAPIGVAAGHGRIKQQTHFRINDTAAFARFTEYLITQDVFTWRLKSVDVQAKAFSFIAVNGLEFTKDLTLPGMANMTDVSISDFQLPGDDPAGGITLAVTTQFTNPSAFGVEMGILTVGLYYDGLYLGPASTIAPFNLTSGVNTVTLQGRMIPYTDDPAALVKLSTVFSNYLNGIVTPVSAVGLTVSLAGVTPAWLSKGVKALVLNVPLVSASGPIRPITGITIEQLSLGFTPETSWAPSANSSFTSATFALPFGFTLDIVQLSNSFSIINNGNAVASLNAPLGDSVTTIITQNSASTRGSITLDLPLSPLSVGSSYEEHLAFSQFNYDLTTTNGSKFILFGSSDAVTNTPIGQVKLLGIKFVVPSGLIGLSGLATFPTEILSVDVLGGSTDAVMLNINFGLTNPSNLDLQVGDVTFQLFNGNSFLGTTVIPNLHLAQGYHEYLSVGYFQANDNAVALQTFADYAQGVSNELRIVGFNGSTQVDSLTQAFMGVTLMTNLTGLPTKLLAYANLTVLPTTGVTSDGAKSVVGLNNPFTSDLRISNIHSIVTSHGLLVGSIFQAVDFPAVGKATSFSPDLTLNLNLFPPDIFSLLRVLGVESGQNPAALDGIVQLGNIIYTPSTVSEIGIAKRSQEQQNFMDSQVLPAKLGRLEAENSFEHMVFPDTTSINSLNKRAPFDYTGFNLPTYVTQAFKSLTVTVNLVSVLHIGNFTTNLAYIQTGVPAYTDSSLILLLPILARPIVQKIVDASILAITSVMITNPSDASFTSGLVGAITNAGPFDATIIFPQGLTVSWNGASIGQIAMPPTSLVANVGATLNLKALTTVASVSHLTDFTSYLLTEPSFTWQIYGQGLQVVALGITVDQISISKTVVLAGMNGFRGDVTIESFDLPANDPAGGVSLVLQTSLRNPSAIGVELAMIGFENSFGNTPIGPAGSTAAFSLSPLSTIPLQLSGRLIPQTTQQGLDDVSTIFNGYIHGVPSQLVVRGAYAGPPDCTWLNQGILILAIPVILPAAQNLQVINSIKINQMTLMFTEATAYNPAFSTSNTVASFQLPFAFPVDITSIQTTLTASDGSQVSRMTKRDIGDFAELLVPLLPSLTNVVARTLLLTFNDVPFTSLDNNVFSSFLTATTDDVSKSFGLHGSADTLTSTAIGNLNLQDVAFSVTTSVLGLQGLNARPATVSNLDVFHGYPTYLQINANAQLYNPSNITIGTGDVTFALSFQGQIIGTAAIKGLVLVPGINIVPTAVHYEPSGGASTLAGLQLLENYVQGIESDTIILGQTGSGTTAIKSLQVALGTIKLNTVIPPITVNLITQASLTFPINIASVIPAIATSQFQLANPFTASINLQSVLANATFQGHFLGQIRVDSLSPATSAPGHSTITSPALPLTLNADPKALAAFLVAAATTQGVDLGILLPQFAFLASEVSTVSTVSSSVNSNAETCTLSGTTSLVNSLILASVKNLVTNLSIVSNTLLDDFATPLSFVQNNVPTFLDNTVLYLTGILGKTLVSQIVEQSTLAFTGGLVTNVTDTGFSVELTGALLNAGPFDALISFPNGVNVMWQGKDIATIALPPMCSTGSIGVPNLQTSSVLTITNQEAFTEYATYILLNPGFEWTIFTNTLQVEALGTIFDNVVLTKTISFTAFNGLPGVSIVNPDFPGDSGTSILLSTTSIIPSQSNLGIELGAVSFIASFMGEEVGPIASTGLTLLPLGSVSTTLTGTILQRTTAASTSSLGILFSGFLAGKNQTLSVTGNEVITPAQPNSPVTWLSAAFKKLTLDVILPGKTYTIIESIVLEDFSINILEASEAYSIPASNNLTTVVYQNPFAFSLTAIAAGGQFIINYGGVDAAALNLPLAPVLSAGTSNGNLQPLTLNFQDEILQSIDTVAFQSFFAAVTTTTQPSFLLHGTSNVTARTVVGNLLITGIPFSVTTSFKGIDGFGGVASIPQTPIVIGSGSGNPFSPTAGGSEYMRITLTVFLNNVAPLILLTNMVSFQVIYLGTYVGRAYINPLNLYPGVTTTLSEFQYKPVDPNNIVAQSFLTAYLSRKSSIPFTIQGDTTSSPYGSLQQAFAETTLLSSFPGQGDPLIHDIVIAFDTVTAFCDGYVSITTRLNNNLEADITLISLKGTAYQGGTEYATFDTSLSTPLVAPAQVTSAYSVPISPVNLTQGAAGSGGLIGTESQGLDINITASTNVGGYNIPSLAYFQAAVPYTIVPSYGGQPLTSSNTGSSFSALVSELSAGTQCQNGQLYSKNGTTTIPGFPAIPGLPVKRNHNKEFLPVTKEYMQDLFSRHGFFVGTV